MPTRRSLLEFSIPTPADPSQGPGSSPPLGLLRNAENVSIGMGYGEQNQLAGLLGMVQHPIQTLNALNEIGRRPSQWVPMIGNALQSTARNAMSGPLGFGQVIGENIGPRTLFGGNAMRRDMVAHHGSPHDFDQFDIKKIGTGEGAQAYGHGLYFAENPSVANQYRQVAGVGGPDGEFLIPERARSEIQQLITAQDAAGNAVAAGTLDDLLTGNATPDSLRKSLDQSLRFNEIDKAEHAAGLAALKSAQDVFAKHRGKLYTVDIPDDAIGKMLDWDKPLSEQPENVQNAFKKLGIDKSVFPQWTGQQAYEGEIRALTEFDRVPKDIAKQRYSEQLRQAGIPGIRYLDGGSRGAGTGTRNFVVFDDKLVKVLKKE